MLFLIGLTRFLIGGRGVLHNTLVFYKPLICLIATDTRASVIMPLGRTMQAHWGVMCYAMGQGMSYQYLYLITMVSGKSYPWRLMA